ncbi:MAG: hypothetical protein WBA97_06020 [Actinophytocola sp.]
MGLIARRLVGMLGGRVMAHNSVDGLPDLVAAAGLTIIGTGIAGLCCAMN